MGGVFLGVAALIVVLAVMTGFQDGIRDRIIAANPHLLVFQTGPTGMLDAGRVAARVREVRGVRAATPFVLQQALFTSPGGDAHGGLVRGVDLSDAAVAGDLAAQLRGGRIESFAEGGDGILLGIELARMLGVLPGDPVTVISPKGALTAVGMVPKMRRFTVAGTIQVGMHEYDSSIAYLPLGAAREFAGLAGVTGVEVKLVDPFDAKAVGAGHRHPAGRHLLGARLDGDEPQPLRRPPAREARALRDRDHHRAGGGLRDHRPPGAPGGREAQGDRHPQVDRRHRRLASRPSSSPSG